MRIGTWNLEGRWDSRHQALIDRMDCDVLLLTEVSERVALEAHEMHASESLMAARRRWSAVASRIGLEPLPDPHGASASALADGMQVCSSILPWRSCGDRPPWHGSTTAERTVHALAAIEPSRPTVWGGDWNHALAGREWTGSVAGRRALLDTVTRLGLQVATAAQPHQVEGLLSIDHVAVPRQWEVAGVERIRAFADGARLSDHDAYVVEVRGVCGAPRSRE